MATKNEIERAEERFCKIVMRGDFLITRIIEAAALYWEGINGDFCIQNCNGETIVFGSTNRLIYSPFTGFTADGSYCSERFLANYDRLGPLPGRNS